MTNTEHAQTIEVGKTYHIANGCRYAGAWTITEIREVQEYKGNTWFGVSDGRRQWNIRCEDSFETEPAARAACKARRAPRRTAQPAMVDAGGWAAWGQMYTQLAKAGKSSKA